MRRILLNFIIFSFPIIVSFLPNNTSYAQRPNDINGWNKAKWGMTENDIRRIYKDDIKEKKTTFKGGDYECNLAIENLKILDDIDETVEVAFCVDKNSKLLNRVYIHAYNEKTISPVFLEKLKSGLMGKYGKYDDSELSNDEFTQKDVYFWYFPSTKIALTVYDERTVYRGADNSCVFQIIYDKSNNSDKL